MDDTALTSNRFGKLAENSTVLIEVTASDRENIDTQTAEIPQAWPKRAKIKPIIFAPPQPIRCFLPIDGPSRH